MMIESSNMKCVENMEPVAVWDGNQSDELTTLIEVYEIARLIEDEACERFGRFEERESFERRRTVTRVQHEEAARGEEQANAHQAVDKALWDLCCYRPNNLDEVRRRSDFILANVPRLKDFNGELLAALFESTATEAV